MRRPTAILLVLMGGGAVLWGATRGPSRACLEARAQHRLDAETLCASSSGGRGGSGGYYHSGAGGSGTSAAAAVARGGFGAAGHAASAGS